MTGGAVILVTGSSGQLGSELSDLAPQYPQFDFIFFDRNKLDITNPAKIQEVFEQYRPSVLINCAAYTAVDKAEEEQELAMLINANGAENLAKATASHQCHFFHISTDYVFDGNGKDPYKEDDLTDPINVYAASKLIGEELVLKANPSSIIIRTSWVYSSHGKNFVKTMFRLMKEKDSINVVNDQIGSPTYAADLAKVILEIINGNKWEPGIFHYSNEGNISWFELAVAINELTESNCNVIPISTEEYPTIAKRPAYSSLDNNKIRSVYGIQPRLWQDSLLECISKLK